MPQLNPSPWLMIFMLIWPFLMIVMLNKTLNLPLTNQPLAMKTEKKYMTPWNWPWY
uniref:ATP synthase complex subunit 8 n=1 Tax=Anolis punctatus TaxID=174263 RepID=A0A513X1A9_ANOPN|nr:ATP synthase F0 subunit 8 [Anolis punctatus]QDH07717.1 ATP synthase F0 subunit 8 [Anolis punctatus]